MSEATTAGTESGTATHGLQGELQNSSTERKQPQVCWARPFTQSCRKCKFTYSDTKQSSGRRDGAQCRFGRWWTGTVWTVGIALQARAWSELTNRTTYTHAGGGFLRRLHRAVRQSEQLPELGVCTRLLLQPAHCQLGAKDKRGSKSIADARGLDLEGSGKPAGPCSVKSRVQRMDVGQRGNQLRQHSEQSTRGALSCLSCCGTTGHRLTLRGIRFMQLAAGCSTGEHPFTFAHHNSFLSSIAGQLCHVLKSCASSATSRNLHSACGLPGLRLLPAELLPWNCFPRAPLGLLLPLGPAQAFLRKPHCWFKFYVPVVPQKTSGSNLPTKYWQETRNPASRQRRSKSKWPSRGATLV